MTKKLHKGFTLIELLVVIAIIGILSSIVLASLNTARAKGADAAIKGDLNGTRAQAELYYDGVGAQSYGSFTAAACDATPAGVFNDANVKQALAHAIAQSGQTGASASLCAANGTNYVEAVALKTSGSTSWCVDNTGVSKQEAFAPASAYTGFACK